MTTTYKIPLNATAGAEGKPEGWIYLRKGEIPIWFLAMREKAKFPYLLKQNDERTGYPCQCGNETTSFNRCPHCERSGGANDYYEEQQREASQFVPEDGETDAERNQ